MYRQFSFALISRLTFPPEISLFYIGACYGLLSSKHHLHTVQVNCTTFVQKHWEKLSLNQALHYILSLASFTYKYRELPSNILFKQSIIPQNPSFRVILLLYITFSTPVIIHIPSNHSSNMPSRVGKGEKLPSSECQ